MKSLCFVHQSKAQLPELQAYADYFRPRYQVEVSSPDADLSGYDIVWFFMGFSRYQPGNGQFIVHEYASLSTPPLARVKDLIKRQLTTRPHLRVFQNKAQSRLMRFNDAVPERFRDMGIAGHFKQQLEAKKQCDLIYSGSMDKSRRLEHALDIVLKLRPLASIWLVGQPSVYLQQRYQHYANVRFIGSVPNSQIPALLNQAHFGLNYIPDVYPYHFQTSTKLLEYAACGLPIIGNNNSWVTNFLAQHPLPYHDLQQLTVWPQAEDVIISPQTLASWSWQQRIADAGFETILPG